MNESFNVAWPPADRARLGGLFERLGTWGFYLQIALLALPLIALLHYLLITLPGLGGEARFGLKHLLSLLSIAVLLFTTYWFYRYIGLGQRIAGAEPCPPLQRVLSKLRIGIRVGGLGILFSMLLLFAAVLQMLYILVTNPQMGLLVSPASGDPSINSLSAFDVLSLALLMCMLAAELIVMAFSLQLLFRVLRPAKS